MHATATSDPLTPAANSRPTPGASPGTRLMSLSLDLDNLWTYLKTHGDPGWESFPSYLDTLVEILLERLEAHALTITVFVVGQDAALGANQRALARLAEAGHEIGNHSFSHEPWIQRYSIGALEQDIDKAEQAIEQATGHRPRGFRGPGFTRSDDLLRILAARDYLYDGSRLPTFLGPLARAFYLRGVRGIPAGELEKRNQLFGTFRDGLGPNRAHCREVEGRRLVDIPVTTLPVARTPIHMSYLVYLAGYSPTLCRAYLRTAVALCKVTRLEPSFLLHPLDFLGGDQVRELSFFPGMQLDTVFKLRLFDQVVTALKRAFTVVPMIEHARVVLARRDALGPSGSKARVSPGSTNGGLTS